MVYFSFLHTYLLFFLTVNKDSMADRIAVELWTDSGSTFTRSFANLLTICQRVKTS